MPFKNTPINKKLTLIIALTSMLVLAVASGAFIAYELITFRQQMTRHLKIIAQIIGDNSNYAVYFNRGNTFNVSNTMSLGGSNIVVGAYGSGSMPILKWNGPRQFDAFIWARGTNNGSTVQDLVFDTIYTDSEETNMPDALTSSGTNFTARNCQFLNVGAAFSGNMQPRGVLMQDNSAPSITGIKAYFIWAEGSDYTILGNKVANSTREHILRVAGADRLTAEYNDFTNMNRVSVDKWDIAKGDMTIHKGNYMYIAYNTLSGGPLSFGPLAGSTGTGGCAHSSPGMAGLVRST